jgi:hypothetical protein
LRVAMKFRDRFVDQLNQVAAAEFLHDGWLGCVSVRIGD